MSYKAVLFDMDGVIVNSEPLHVAAFRATLQQYGHTLTDDHYKQYFAGRTDEEGFRRYFAFVNEVIDVPAIISESSKVYLELAADQLVAYPGVVELIRAVAARQLPMALVTGSLRAEAEVTLRALDLTKYFAVIIAAEDLTHSKPHPGGYLRAAKTLGVDPAACLVIEDAPSGVQAAKAAGMDCVAVTTTHSAAELHGATVVVDQLGPDSRADII